MLGADMLAIRRLRYALAEDIMAMTDDEIQAEAIEDGVDLEAQAAAMRSAFSVLVREACRAEHGRDMEDKCVAALAPEIPRFSSSREPLGTDGAEGIDQF